ncbi:MAG: NAD(P)H-binding protein [Prolixibacteraceae bacterium]|nr:NAD(P)H-binding protein [Prolixibacteraceae bacterium]
MKTALVAGATGLVGKQLILELISNNEYQKIIVLSRRELAIKHPKLAVKLVSFDQLDDQEYKERIDVCFCALGTTQKKSGRDGLTKVDFNYVIKLAQLAERSHIRRFIVVSSQGANANSNFFYMRTKGQMELALKKTSIPSIYIVRPSLITGDREEFRFGEEVGYYLYKAFQPMMNGRFRKLRAVSGLQIARCMIDLAENAQDGYHLVESDVVQSY